MKSIFILEPGISLRSINVTDRQYDFLRAKYLKDNVFVEAKLGQIMPASQIYMLSLNHLTAKRLKFIYDLDVYYGKKNEPLLD